MSGKIQLKPPLDAEWLDGLESDLKQGIAIQYADGMVRIEAIREMWSELEQREKREERKKGHREDH